MLRTLSRILLLLALAALPLSAQRATIPEQLVFTPDHASGIYDVGETVGWTVTPGPTPPTYAYKWTIRRNNALVLQEGTLDLSSGTAAIHIVADQPGMIYVAVEAYAEPASTPAAPTDEAPHFEGGNTGRNTGFYAVGPRWRRRRLACLHPVRPTSTRSGKASSPRRPGYPSMPR